MLVGLPEVPTLASPTSRKWLVPTYNRAGALEKVVLSHDEEGQAVALSVDRLAYNARGQRLLVAMGNGMMTRSSYDPKSFRLLSQRTEGFDAPDALMYEPRSGTGCQEWAQARRYSVRV